MSIYKDLKPLSLEEVKTYPLASRASKVTVKDFAKPVTEDSSLRDYLNSLPNILAVESLRALSPLAQQPATNASMFPLPVGEV